MIFPFGRGNNFPFVIHMPETQGISFLTEIFPTPVQPCDTLRILNILLCSVHKTVNFIHSIFSQTQIKYGKTQSYTRLTADHPRSICREQNVLIVCYRYFLLITPRGLLIKTKAYLKMISLRLVNE